MNDIRNLLVRVGRISNAFITKFIRDITVTHFWQQKKSLLRTFRMKIRLVRIK